MENYADSELNLDNLQNIRALYVSNALKLESISFAKLEAIAQGFNLDTLPALVSLSAPNLQSVDTFNWTATGNNWQAPDLPSLKSVWSGWILETGLRNLGTLSLFEEDLNLYMTDNQYLTNVSLPYLQGSGNTVLQIISAGGVIVDLPNLANGTVNCYSGCASVSVPVLADCGGIYGYFGLADSSATSLSLPALKTCDGGLFIGMNPNLADLSMPLLESAATITQPMAQWDVRMNIGENPLLTGTLSFPALRTVAGAFFNGSFSGISMPSLANETGTFAINSTQDVTSTCKHFQSIAGPDNIIKGDFTCGFASESSTCVYNATQGMCTYTGGSTGGSSGGASDHRGSIIGGATGGAIAFVVMLASLLVGGYIFRMRKKAGRTVVKNDFKSTTSEDWSEKQSPFTDDVASTSSAKTDMESEPSLEEIVEYPKRG